jgi:hypothetical protein
MAIISRISVSSVLSLALVRYSALIEREVDQRDWNCYRICCVDGLQMFSTVLLSSFVFHKYEKLAWPELISQGLSEGSHIMTRSHEDGGAIGILNGICLIYDTGKYTQIWITYIWNICAETLNILAHWSWVYYLENKIGCCAVDCCWLLNTEQYWNPPDC